MQFLIVKFQSIRSIKLGQNRACTRAIFRARTLRVRAVFLSRPHPLLCISSRGYGVSCLQLVRVNLRLWIQTIKCQINIAYNVPKLEVMGLSLICVRCELFLLACLHRELSVPTSRLSYQQLWTETNDEVNLL